MWNAVQTELREVAWIASVVFSLSVAGVLLVLPWLSPNEGLSYDEPRVARCVSWPAGAA